MLLKSSKNFKRYQQLLQPVQGYCVNVQFYIEFKKEINENSHNSISYEIFVLTNIVQQKFHKNSLEIY